MKCLHYSPVQVEKYDLTDPNSWALRLDGRLSKTGMSFPEAERAYKEAKRLAKEGKRKR